MLFDSGVAPEVARGAASTASSSQSMEKSRTDSCARGFSGRERKRLFIATQSVLEPWLGIASYEKKIQVLDTPQQARTRACAECGGSTDE